MSIAHSYRRAEKNAQLFEYKCVEFVESCVRHLRKIRFEVRAPASPVPAHFLFFFSPPLLLAP